MKTLQMISFFFLLLALGQTPKYLTLELSTGDCRKNEAVRTGYQDTIRFFRKSKLVYQIIPMNYHEWPITIRNFKTGEYTVSYRNLYDKKVSKVMMIPDTSDEFELRLCPDELAEHRYNTLEQLKDREAIKIDFVSEGCFHKHHENLMITRQGKLLVAELTDDAGKQSTILKPSDIEAFQRFENEIRELRDDDYGCTTVDTYTITSKYWTLKKMDGGCTWDGYGFLRDAIFSSTE